MTNRDVAASDVISALGGLAEPAPDGLVDRTLVATGHLDQYTVVPGPTEPLAVAFNDHGIAGVVPSGVSDAAALEARTGRPAVAGELPDRLARSLERALRTGKVGTLPIDTRSMSEFQVAVLRKATEIPPGELRPYGWLAREIGQPQASRAVGTALARNPVPVLLPCHRVSRSDGSIGNYAFGPEMKRALLEAEGLDADRHSDELRRGIRYIGTDTTTVYCLPTCRHARRITDRHRQEFRSVAAAEDAGKRPCAVCRPRVA